MSARTFTIADLPRALRGEDLADAFANFDVFLFSVTDTFGLAILEAMASGVPVLATRETGARASVVDGVIGMLSDNLLPGLLTLAANEETRRWMGRAARQHAEANAWSGVFEDLYRIYSQGLRTEETLRRWPTPKVPVPNRNGSH